jgi:hypothetical protein
MKTKIIILIIISAFMIMISCETNSIKSGITGTLQYGEGNCSLDQSFRTYNSYSGYIHFVNTAVKDTFSGPVNKLLDISDSTIASIGDFKMKLEPGNYYLCIRSYPVLNSENLFIVQPNQTTEQNFWIYKCM